VSRAEVLIITEGATEREVGNVLYQKGILHNGLTYRLPSGIRPRQGYDAVVDILTNENNPLLALQGTGGKVLFVLDQEDSPSPLDRKDQFLRDLQQRDKYGFWHGILFAHSLVGVNIFEYQANNLHLVLHISDAIVPGISRRDFDGYILSILQNSNINQQVVSRIDERQNCQQLLHKAEIEFTNLMVSNGYLWTHAKSWLYAYITAFQYRGSHVWFARDVVKYTPDDELRQVFASLIAAWNRF
jgi:hypothetical protein